MGIESGSNLVPPAESAGEEKQVPVVSSASQSSDSIDRAPKKREQDSPEQLAADANAETVAGEFVAKTNKDTVRDFEPVKPDPSVSAQTDEWQVPDTPEEEAWNEPEPEDAPSYDERHARLLFRNYRQEHFKQGGTRGVGEYAGALPFLVTYHSRLHIQQNPEDDPTAIEDEVEADRRQQRVERAAYTAIQEEYGVSEDDLYRMQKVDDTYRQDPKAINVLPPEKHKEPWYKRLNPFRR